MSIDSVRHFFAAKAPDIVVREAAESTATVALAAAAFGVAPGQIAKTLSLRVGETVFLLVTAGTARLNNGKAKPAFGGKTRMLCAQPVMDQETAFLAALQMATQYQFESGRLVLRDADGAIQATFVRGSR